MIWILIKRFLTCRAEGDDDTPPPDDDDTPPPDDDDTPPPDDDDTPPPDDDTPPPPDDDTPPPADKPESRAAKEIRTLRERAQKAEDDHRKAMAELEVARRPQPQQVASQEQLLFDEEAKVLRDPNIEPWQKYAIEGRREARAANAASQNALRRAEDLADKTEFQQVATARPNTFARYKDDVEKMLTEIRKNGGNAPRKQLLALCIGRDQLDGKFKTESKSAKTGGAPRGKTPGVKSDASSSGSAKGQSLDALEKRLAGVRI